MCTYIYIYIYIHVQRDKRWIRSRSMDSVAACDPARSESEVSAALTTRGRSPPTKHSRQHPVLAPRHIHQVFTNVHAHPSRELVIRIIH